LFAQLDNASPPPLIVILVVLTVVQFTFSDHVIVILLFNAIFVAVLTGTVELTVGAVLSMVTVLPAPGVSVLAEESVARLLML
jgi:hypothetical protein